MRTKLLDNVLILVVVVFLILAVWTVLPAQTSSLSDLGYHTACPFAPWSTLAMLVVAGGAWTMRQYFRTRPY